MNSKYVTIENGTVTTPRGFLAGAVEAGIKMNKQLDLALLYSEVTCDAAAVFTTAKVKSAPVLVTRDHLRGNAAQAIVVNSGCANACMGKQGIEDAVEMVRAASHKLNVDESRVLVSSTGVIGAKLPMDKIISGINRIQLSSEGGLDFAKAIMTTDTRMKFSALKSTCLKDQFSLGGVAKGSGMIHPNMATMLCYLTTDAAVEGEFLRKAIYKAVRRSFNMITVDGDTSPSDTVILLANGLAGNTLIREENGELFQQMLDDICVYLAKSIARDGEGATKLIEVSIKGAVSYEDARLAARTIAGSALVKAAVHGNDPNWGRIVAAIGRSGAEVVEAKLDIFINNICVMKQGSPAGFDETGLSRSMTGENDTVFIEGNLNLGDCQALAWGCDLSKEYVTINSAYTT